MMIVVAVIKVMIKLITMAVMRKRAEKNIKN